MNLYFKFDDPVARRTFLTALLIGEARARGGLMQKQLEHFFELVEGKRRDNPFFNLERSFRDVQAHWEPTDPMAAVRPDTLYLRGFRGIFTQKSHGGQNGHWLVLRFRNSKPGLLLFATLARQADSVQGEGNPNEFAHQWYPISYPDRLETWHSMYNYAQLLMVNGKLSEAMEILMFIYYNLPWYFLRDERLYIWEELAFEFENAERMLEAEFALRIHSSLQPESTDPFLNLGTFYLWRDLYEDAMNVFLEGLCRNPSDEYLQYNLATVYTLWDDDDAILSTLNRAIVQSPESGVLWKLKGDLYFDRDRFEEAKRCYRKALRCGLESWPELHVIVLNNLGLAEARSGEIQQAINSLEKALQLDGSNVDCLLNLSTILGREAGEQEKAQKAALKAVKIDPSNARARHNLGLALMQGNVMLEAEWHLRKARQLDPQHPAVRDSLAECLRRRKGL